MTTNAIGVARRVQPLRQHLRRIVAANQRQQRIGIEEFLLHKATQILANAIFVARNNCRMT